MSRRTLEAAKAVRLAWENEQKLVLDGKGTRDWTPEQQQSIIEKGKAYDDNGKAFEGHHMKSAEAYPEFQSFPDNIEFLTRSEHQDAHGGNFQNSTNGYYDPFTLKTTNFNDDSYIPCKIIELSSPVQMASVDVNIDANRAENDSPEMEPETNSTIKGNNYKEPRYSQSSSTAPKVHGRWTSHIIRTVKNVGYQASALSQKAIKYAKENPDKVIRAIGTIGTIFAGICLENKSSSNSKSDTPTNNGRKISLRDDSSHDFIFSDTDDYDSMADSADYNEGNSRNYPDERSSPKEHTVPGHGQHYHTKDGVIWREKEPYQRGGTSEDS